LQLVHSSDFLQEIQQRCESKNPSSAADHRDTVADTYLCPRSFAVASGAVGGVIDLVKAVLDGELSNGLAVVRPPGHHACADRAAGFCVFNTVAVAAKYASGYATERGLRRVMIVDWDVHHG